MSCDYSSSESDPYSACSASYWVKVRPFVAGGLAGCLSATAVLPIDLVKVRTQAAAGNAGGVRHVAREMWRTEGWRGFFRGIKAAWVRQIVYKGTQLGLFESLVPPGEQHSPLTVLEAGLISGAASGLVSTPIDVVLVRAQTAAKNPSNTHGFLSSLGELWREGALFRGVLPTIARSQLIAVGLQGSNTLLRENLVARNYCSRGNAVLIGAFGGALTCCFLAMPADYVKTQMQKAGETSNGSSLKVLQETVRNGGITRLYTGWPAFVAKQGPQAVMTLLWLDFLNRHLPK